MAIDRRTVGCQGGRTSTTRAVSRQVSVDASYDASGGGRQFSHAAARRFSASTRGADAFSYFRPLASLHCGRARTQAATPVFHCAATKGTEGSDLRLCLDGAAGITAVCCTLHGACDRPVASHAGIHHLLGPPQPSGHMPWGCADSRTLGCARTFATMQPVLLPRVILLSQLLEDQARVLRPLCTVRAVCGHCTRCSAPRAHPIFHTQRCVGSAVLV